MKHVEELIDVTSRLCINLVHLVYRMLQNVEAL
jgi:hypothetical protein